jgi:hypothetical protein
MKGECILFKFLKNVFKNKNHIYVDGMEIIIDKKKGKMKILTDSYLTEHQIKKLFEKYVLGEN